MVKDTQSEPARGAEPMEFSEEVWLLAYYQNAYLDRISKKYNYGAQDGASRVAERYQYITP